MTREHTDERHPAPGYAPEDDQAFDPSTDDFISKERNYTHFDLPLSEEKRRNFRADPARIAQHSFWPLLGFTKTERRVRYDSVRGRYVEPKARDIKFGSHTDAALLQHYANQLSECYEQYLDEKPFANAILAYRSGMGDNVTQARDLISEIKDRKDVIAVAMDIKGFFDNIDHRVLLAALKKVVGEERLADHHFRIFQRMTKFEWVESD
jgi:RNA-directed DNA polymerase